MKFAYKFSNLCGSVYHQGNVLFTPDGNSVLSPVGNRVSIFDLVNNTSRTLPFENRCNIIRLALSRDGALLISIDEEGRALLINLPKNCVIHHFNFKSPVTDLQFSPDGRRFAVTHKNQVHIWRMPGAEKEFAMLTLDRRLASLHAPVTCLAWSSDSKFLAVGTRNNTAKVFSITHIPHYHPVTLTAHRDRIVGLFFAGDSNDLYSVSRDGTALHWHAKAEEVTEEVPADAPQGPSKRQRKGKSRAVVLSDAAPDSAAMEDDSGSSSSSSESESEAGDDAEKATAGQTVTYTKHKWWLAKEDKHYFLQNHAKVVCATFHAATGLLVAGFSTGVFGLYEMPDFNNIHTLSISQKRISSVAINPGGEWLAIGCARLGQLLVWEWCSETYVLKQQGHAYDMSVLAFSPDGQLIATGGDDAKVKLWNTTSGFCFVTFAEHTASITGIKFAQSGLAVVTSSLDGTVRAFDTTRYRNFRTFTAPHPTQFACLALDNSGELVTAGALDTFDVFVWNMRTGRLLEVLAGHEGPISSLSFSPVSAVLVSGSWDKSIRVWDIFEHKESVEPIVHTTDVVALAYRPDGAQIVVSTLDAQLSFWDMLKSRISGTIDARHDVLGGRLAEDRMAAKSSDQSKQFTSLCYSADGTHLLAGGATKYVCIYDVTQLVLLRRFCVSANRSIDGTLRMLNSSNMTEAGALDLIDDYSDSDLEERLDRSLPGVKKGDKSSRRTRPEIRTRCVQFSPSGRAWSAATTEGLMIYSLDDAYAFDPFDLSLEITPASIKKVLADSEYAKALVMAFRLNETPLLHEVVETIPRRDIALIVEFLPAVFVARLLMFVSKQLESSRHIEFYLDWCVTILTVHGSYIRTNLRTHAVSLRAVQKALSGQRDALGRISNDNLYQMRYLLHRFDTVATSESLGALEEAQ
eukprot:m.240821 g.240821  ORF g.240821 m.240821 type:complete len:917 (-) comp13732_c0_seq1:165-2915(-)